MWITSLRTLVGLTAFFVLVPLSAGEEVKVVDACPGQDLILSCSDQPGTGIYIVWEETYFWISITGQRGKPWICTGDVPPSEERVCQTKLDETDAFTHRGELHNCGKKSQCSVRTVTVSVGGCSEYDSDGETVTYQCRPQSTSKATVSSTTTSTTRSTTGSTTTSASEAATTSAYSISSASSKVKPSPSTTVSSSIIPSIFTTAGGVFQSDSNGSSHPFGSGTSRPSSAQPNARTSVKTGEASESGNGDETNAATASSGLISQRTTDVTEVTQVAANQTGDSDTNTEVIAGTVAGVSFLVVTLVVIVYVCCRRNTKSLHQAFDATEIDQNSTRDISEMCAKPTKPTWRQDNSNKEERSSRTDSADLTSTQEVERDRRDSLDISQTPGKKLDTKLESKTEEITYANMGGGATSRQHVDDSASLELDMVENDLYD